MVSINEKIHSKEVFSKKELSKGDRKIDERIANIVNRLEGLQLGELNTNNEEMIKGLVNDLNYFAKKYAGRVKAYIDEIWDCLQGLACLYDPKGKLLYDEAAIRF